MPDNQSDQNGSPVPKDARTRRNWWYKAKRFVVRESGMYDMGDNANLNISESHINANVVIITERVVSSTSHSEQRVATDPVHEGITVVQDDQESEDEVPEIAPPQASSETNAVSPILPSDAENIFDSEAIAEYADPDVPLDMPTTYSCTSRARAHIYSLGMLTHRAGYPLYVPTPCWGLPMTYRKKGIRIGDVGVLTADGAFDFFFNICEPDASNSVVLPDEFELLEPSTRSYRKFGSTTCLASDHVNHANTEGAHREWSPSFKCSAAEGAVLVLPTGATFYQAMNRLHFQNHASRHAISWYKYMLNIGRDNVNGSLYLVTECIKSTNWGISVFYALQTADSSLHFISNGGMHRWVSRGKVERKAGPEPMDITVLDGEEPNQCVFLRGFKIMLRPDIWDKLRKAVDVTCQDGGIFSLPSTTKTTTKMSHSASNHASDPSNETSSQVNQLMLSRTPELPGCPISIPKTAGDWSSLGEVILKDNFSHETLLHPSDTINSMLLHSKPEAKVSIVHDSAWCEKLPHDFIADPANPNIDDLLENVKRAYEAVIDEHGSVILSSPSSAELEAPMTNDSSTVVGKNARLVRHDPDSPIEQVGVISTFM